MRALASCVFCVLLVRNTSCPSVRWAGYFRVSTPWQRSKQSPGQSGHSLSIDFVVIQTHPQNHRTVWCNSSCNFPSFQASWVCRFSYIWRWSKIVISISHKTEVSILAFEENVSKLWLSELPLCSHFKMNLKRNLMISWNKLALQFPSPFNFIHWDSAYFSLNLKCCCCCAWKCYQHNLPNFVIKKKKK